MLSQNIVIFSIIFYDIEKYFYGVMLLKVKKWALF